MKAPGPWMMAATTAIAAVGVFVVRGRHRRLGASLKEVTDRRPGDELLVGPVVQADRACTIDAAPEAVWPWIAQLGQDKAGFYSFELLENLVGCRITGSERVHPEWQKLHVGDPFRLHPRVALRVASVEPGRHLVVTSQGGDAPGNADFDMTWAFCLSSPEGLGGRPTTRLHLRERYAAHRRADRFGGGFMSVVSAVMTWRMMARLRTLVPRA
ncbi:hypothetical protein BHE97_06040 [Aeromicrobium sp. PE09-221]|uniref:hypothetical protein n=1 Tax=Aeromicrobium sp. PE09-221 TaxID=1898043 RepID=UPI000B3E87DB|nr:hypothetical protein [Aeromicrobium sp. PE09-221]OUZ10989.1 hypothetical protein BHE97_06040 [Aeromicrobium sp. PE09-221]